MRESVPDGDPGEGEARVLEAPGAVVAIEGARQRGGGGVLGGRDVRRARHRDDQAHPGAGGGVDRVRRRRFS